MIGEVWIHTRKVGEPWRLHKHERNLVTDHGKNVTRDLLLGSGISPRAIAVGTGTTAPAVTDTALQTEVFRKVITRRSSSSKKATFQMLLLTTEANGNDLAEAGLFDTSIASQGTVIARVIYGAVTKTSAIEVTYTWEITVS